eukprot:Opistho-1_new@31340
MAEREPFLLDEHAETDDGAIVRVQHQHGQRGKLRGAVPAVAAVDEDGERLGRHNPRDLRGAVQHRTHVVQPLRALEVPEPPIVVDGRAHNFAEGTHGLTHHVDVRDAEEVHPRAVVRVGRFVSAAAREVEEGVHFAACVHYAKGSVRGIGVTYRAQHRLVFVRSHAAHAAVRLPRADDRRAREWVHPRQRREAPVAPELRHRRNRRVVHRRRHRNGRGIARAHGIIRVRRRQPPLGVLRQTLSTELGATFVQVPPFVATRRERTQGERDRGHGYTRRCRRRRSPFARTEDARWSRVASNESVSILNNVRSALPRSLLAHVPHGANNRDIHVHACARAVPCLVRMRLFLVRRTRGRRRRRRGRIDAGIARGGVVACPP